MEDSQVKWMAEKVSEELQGDDREEFLKALKADRASIIRGITMASDRLMALYALEQPGLGVESFSSEPEDANVFVAVGRRVTEYLENTLMKDELAQIT